METKLQIKNKIKIKRIFKTLRSLKKWIIVEDNTSIKWFIYQNGELFVKVEGNISEDIIELKVLMPLFTEVNKAMEILLRPLVSEKDIREILKKESLTLQNETIYYTQKLTLKANTKYLAAIIIDNLNQMSNTGDILTHLVQAKADYISEIILN